jgi:hypothetical protein
MTKDRHPGRAIRDRARGNGKIQQEIDAQTRLPASLIAHR